MLGWTFIGAVEDASDQELLSVRSRCQSSRTLEGLPRSRQPGRQVLKVTCGLSALAIAASYILVAGSPQSHRSVARARGTVERFSFTDIDAGYVDCFINKTFFTEVDGSHSMSFGQRSQEISPYACQFRCMLVKGCQHFSFWSDGGCLLTSYTAYTSRYTGPEDKGVLAGPRSCDMVLPDTTGPELLLQPALGLPPLMAQEALGCGGLHPNYELSWKAQGRTFFDDWQFLTKSETHGAEWYLNKSEAFRNNVVHATDSAAILRVGDQIMPFKRRSVMLHSARAWRPDTGFLLVMKYRHLPYGAGIWPALWLLNSDMLWPHGGELDILEYANDATSKVTFHTNKNCSLNQEKAKKCTAGYEGVDDEVVGRCYTDYVSNELGCKPPQVRRTGQWFSEHPGVIATAWDASGVYVYHIPEAELPADLRRDQPEPIGWDRWLLAVLPLDGGTCEDVAKPQEIVLNIALCGDWAGGAWWNSPEAKATGFVPPYCIPGHVSEPATDCCTIFMSHPTSEDYIKSKAYFDIEYIKVFEPAGVQPSELSAGTYRNGGEPLEEPCVPCGTSRAIPNEQPGGGNICCLGCGRGVFSMENNGTLTCPAAA